jgi:hypothetical protein
MFEDGTDPTITPVSPFQVKCIVPDFLRLKHLLPALTNIAAICALTANQSATYALGYNLAPAGNHSNRKRIIARHIGYHGVWE